MHTNWKLEPRLTTEPKPVCRPQPVNLATRHQQSNCASYKITCHWCHWPEILTDLRYSPSAIHCQDREGCPYQRRTTTTPWLSTNKTSSGAALTHLHPSTLTQQPTNPPKRKAPTSFPGTDQQSVNTFAPRDKIMYANYRTYIAYAHRPYALQHILHAHHARALAYWAYAIYSTKPRTSNTNPSTTVSQAETSLPDTDHTVDPNHMPLNV